MTVVMQILKQLNDIDTEFTGPVNSISHNHWIIGDDNIFPIHIETVAQPNRLIIYGTGMRDTGEPITNSIMTTQFLENLNGYSLGNYGICPGLVTLTVYQVITIHGQFSAERLATEIVCHRMLTECFLESEFYPEDDWPKTVQDLEDNTPIIPFQH